MKLLIVLSLFILTSCISGPSGSNNMTPQQRMVQQGNLNANVNPFDEHQVFVLGSLSGTALGKGVSEYITKMSEDDRYNLALVFVNQTMGKTKRWFNPENETVFSITLTRQHQFTDGSICKEYVMETAQHNEVKEYYGRACKQDNNTWVIVN